MFFRRLLQEKTACAAYLFGCNSTNQFGVVDPHVNLVGSYVELAERESSEIVAAFETHVQAAVPALGPPFCNIGPTRRTVVRRRVRPEYRSP